MDVKSALNATGTCGCSLLKAESIYKVTQDFK